MTLLSWNNLNTEQKDFRFFNWGKRMLYLSKFLGKLWSNGKVMVIL